MNLLHPENINKAYITSAEKEFLESKGAWLNKTIVQSWIIKHDDFIRKILLESIDELIDGKLICHQQILHKFECNIKVGL